LKLAIDDAAVFLISTTVTRDNLWQRGFEVHVRLRPATIRITE
jgi:hypothetical protein